MPSILIGGDKVTSFLSTIFLKPNSGTTTPITPVNNVSGNKAANGAMIFDQSRAKFRRIRHLDDATNSGLWMHTGVRETATSFEMDAHMQFDLRYPVEYWMTMAANKAGFQLIFTISNAAALANAYPSDIPQEYYYCPSVMLSLGETTMDTTTKPPRVVEFDCHIEANAPAFFLPTDQSNLDAFVSYIQGRGWSF